jgi:cyclase
MKIRAIILSALVLAGLATIFAVPGAAQRAKPRGAEYTGAAFSITKIQDGIYHAVGASAMSVGCNASIIVNQDDVMIVDSHASPAAAWALMEELKAITTKPVRFVVNTHFHWDHAHGNQIYGPGVEIIGSEFTRRMLVEGASKGGRSYPMFIGGIPRTIANLKAQIASATDEPSRTKLRMQLAVQENYLTATNAVTVTPPTLTLDESMTLYRGGREIRLLFLGCGHTGGDIVVHLPKERVVATGDLLTAGPSYLGDGYVPDWIETLNQLKALDFDWALPGHGAAFQGKTKIDQFQSYLRDFWSQAQKLHAAGVKAEDAAKQIDMRSHAGDYPTITAAGVLDHGVYQAYDLMEGKIK